MHSPICSHPCRVIRAGGNERPERTLYRARAAYAAGAKMSGRRCSCCSLQNRPELDAAIVSGESKRGIARRFAVSADAVERHARAHLPTALVKAQEAEEVANGDALLRQIQDLQKRTLSILTAAEKDGGDARVALVAVHQARENLVLLSKLLAEMAPTPTAGNVSAYCERLAQQQGLDPDELMRLAEKIADEAAGEIRVQFKFPEPGQFIRKPDA